MSDPVHLCAETVIAKALEGCPPDRLLAMVAPSERVAVARLIGLELACKVLETAPDAFADAHVLVNKKRALLSEEGRGLRRLARLVIALHRVEAAAPAQAEP